MKSRWGFHILWIWFSNCTAFYVGCKPHIVLILSGVIWCRYVALYACGVFSFTYVMNFIVIIDLTCCCFLHYGALALFGWAGVAGTVTCAVDIVEGFMLSIFVLLTGLWYAHFWCAVIQYFSRPAVMFFHLIFCPHHFSTQTDAPAMNLFNRFENRTKRFIHVLEWSDLQLFSSQQFADSNDPFRASLRWTELTSCERACARVWCCESKLQISDFRIHYCNEKIIFRSKLSAVCELNKLKGDLFKPTAMLECRQINISVVKKTKH